jgi:hypothetical protein
MHIPLPRPTPPEYDVSAAQLKSQGERIQLATTNWAKNGYGTPTTVLLFYLIKLVCFVAGWYLFLSLNSDPPTLDTPASWFTYTCFFKTIIWAMCFEIVGLGCGSGPLTGRYWPPIGGFRYFLRVGMIRLPLFGASKLYTRTWYDVTLYAVFIASILWGLCTPEVDPRNAPVLVTLLTLMTLRDKTLFLAARGEHYWVMLMCFAVTDHWFAGIVLVQLAIWLWAAISKCTVHFPFVVTVMTSNAPWQWLSKIRLRMYRQYPSDLRPSAVASHLSKLGTVVEIAFPLMLIMSDGGPVTHAALGLMVLFHLFIIMHVPMGVPLEWNLVMIYGGFFCFSGLFSSPLSHPGLPLSLLLFTTLFLIPLFGNLYPHRISFLPSMRYYAGNWAYSIWLFKGQSSQRLQTAFSPPSKSPRRQLEQLYDSEVANAALESVIAFRSMHLHGRVLHSVIPQTIDDLADYEWLDGEIIAGWMLGWNFGDGHLHDHRLLGAIQQKCNFASGELRCIFVESQPIHKSNLDWRMIDAHDGLITQGSCSSHDLRLRQPFLETQNTSEPSARA